MLYINRNINIHSDLTFGSFSVKDDHSRPFHHCPVFTSHLMLVRKNAFSLIQGYPSDTVCRFYNQILIKSPSPIEYGTFISERADFRMVGQDLFHAAGAAIFSNVNRILRVHHQHIINSVYYNKLFFTVIEYRSVMTTFRYAGPFLLIICD